MSEARDAMPLLVVDGLRTEFRTDTGIVRAVDGVSLAIDRGEVVGLVGESGCGKSALGLSILRLLANNGRVVAGRILLSGVDLTRASEDEMRAVRGKRIAIVFQDPMTSLNPYLTVGEQLAEVGELHRGLTRRAALDRATELLDRVRIVDAPRAARSYPHELSGGMRQRAMIAMALMGEPDLLILDEPTTALDVTVQAQILELVGDVVRERRLSVLLVTHDFGVVARLTGRVLVMYAGRIVESAPTRDLLLRPLHPYTLALLRSVPRIDRAEPRLESIRGLPPRLDQGKFRQCTFADRCAFVHDACRIQEPELTLHAGRSRRCVLPPEALS